jgi:dihydrofolate reductase
MFISLIAALSDNRVIGKNNQLPWHLPADLKHFKAITTGKVIIMGRKTFESLGKPLPNRTNVVISRNTAYVAAGAVVFSSLDAAIKKFSQEKELIVIGGAELYAQAMPLVNHMYLTLVDAVVEGDAYFPAWDPKAWKKISEESHKADERNEYSYRYTEWEKIF